MPFAATWMNPQIIMLSKSDQERQISRDITYMQNLKYDTNEIIYKIETNAPKSKSNLYLPKEKSGWGGINQKLEISKCKFIKQKNNKVLLYSTKNYIQYPVINQNRKESEKEYILFNLLYVRK